PMRLLASMSGYLRVTAPLRSRPRIAGRWVLSPVDAAGRLPELVVVLACGEDAGVSGPASSLRPQSRHSASGRASAPGCYAPRCGPLAAVASGFHPATAAVLCLR